MSRTEQECRKGTISQYFTTLHCPVCDELTQHGICNKCRSQPQHVIVMLNQEIRELERKHEQITKVGIKLVENNSLFNFLQLGHIT